MKKIATSQIQSYIQKARLMGFEIKQIKLQKSGTAYYIIEKSELYHVVLIPSDVTYTGEIEGLHNLKGTIKVIGGSGLLTAREMFKDCFFNYPARNDNILDLTEFDTSNVESMTLMFSGCSANVIDATSFDTSNVNDMYGMFDRCKAKTIDIRAFDTHKVIWMSNMFMECSANILGLENFDTSNVNYMDQMFLRCKTEFLNLSSFNTSSVKNMGCMFYECESKMIDLSNFDESIAKIDGMFDRYSGEIKTNNKRILEAYMNRLQ